METQDILPEIQRTLKSLQSDMLQKENVSELEEYKDELEGLEFIMDEDTLSEQRYTRSVKNQFHPLLRCFHSVYVQYTSIKRLAGIEIAFFPTLRP